MSAALSVAASDLRIPSDPRGVTLLVGALADRIVDGIDRYSEQLRRQPTRQLALANRLHGVLVRVIPAADDALRTRLFPRDLYPGAFRELCPVERDANAIGRAIASGSGEAVTCAVGRLAARRDRLEKLADLLLAEAEELHLYGPEALPVKAERPEATRALAEPAKQRWPAIVGSEMLRNMLANSDALKQGLIRAGGISPSTPKQQEAHSPIDPKAPEPTEEQRPPKAPPEHAPTEAPPAWIDRCLTPKRRDLVRALWRKGPMACSDAWRVLYGRKTYNRHTLKSLIRLTNRQLGSTADLTECYCLIKYSSKSEIELRIT